MSSLQLRTIQTHERDAVLDLLKEWLNDRAFFARYFHHDPAFRDDLCFVACDGDRIVSTFQVFRKQVRVNGQVLQVGGVGNVYTTADYRERGVASDLLRMGLEAMRAHEFDLSLLFAVRLKFYAELGWRSHVRHLLFIDRGDSDGEGKYRIDRFEAADLDAVRAVYESYSSRFNGPTVRDQTYWRGQLQYAGNPHEDFLVARDGERIVAYARGTTLYDFYVITEHAALPGYSDALAQLVRRLHGVEGAPLPGTITHLGIDPDVQGRLQSSGLALRQVEDGFWMWRVIDPTRLAAKLGMTADEVTADDFLFRILPPERSVYWLADRF